MTQPFTTTQDLPQWEGSIMTDFPLTPTEAIAAASLITTHVAEKAGLPAVEKAKAEAWQSGYVAACERYRIELGTYGDKIPPYPSETRLLAIADLIPRWKGWAERLRTWGAANLIPDAVVTIEPDVSGFEALR